ncbi:6-phosphofructokinase [Christiangramia fulva]|uniref:ATP-dependent 6-phosphofructokinase n=1 Tax=Christiangramia fulva TaxID=2126553 RepID=A0A2R3Z6R7_9FLAO|nr:ATP-dependent 6-phosphofructokinase [Christiangramia fulva]AVR45976.1 6-phosphofructokinase [Christiangramia fulva]
MDKFAVLTSGGDAPGLNACINAVVHASAFYGHEIMGVESGYEGLVKNHFFPLKLSELGNINALGGTILKTSRSESFQTKEGRKQAFENLRKNEVKKLIILGGDGSLTGAQIFSEEYPEIGIIGIPKTIDNDISGTEFAIGYDTALNTAVRAIDNIRDTATSHNRVFIVEVMGRDAGYIAYGTGLATGAEGILIPETNMDMVYLTGQIQKHIEKKKPLVIVVAEGDESGGAFSVSKKLKEIIPEREIRVSILGYIQRGGAPSAFDRILATKFGVWAVQSLLEGKSNVMVSSISGKIKHTPLSQVQKRKMKISSSALEMLEICTF